MMNCVDRAVQRIGWLLSVDIPATCTKLIGNGKYVERTGVSRTETQQRCIGSNSKREIIVLINMIGKSNGRASCASSEIEVSVIPEMMHY